MPSNSIWRVLFIPFEPFECPAVRPSVPPFISASFPDSNLNSFDRFSLNFAWTLISERSGLGLQRAKFVYKQQSYSP